jgi:hypothetical protein
MDHSDCSESSNSNSSISTTDPIAIDGMVENGVSISHIHPSVIVESRSFDHHSNGNGQNHCMHNGNHSSSHFHSSIARNSILQYLINDQENNNNLHSHHAHDREEIGVGDHHDYIDQKPNMLDLQESHHDNHQNNSHGTLSNGHHNSTNHNGTNNNNHSQPSPNEDHHGIVSSSSNSR